jgi:hypothetical protein
VPAIISSRSPRVFLWVADSNPPIQKERKSEGLQVTGIFCFVSGGADSVSCMKN